jgi:uncharacterized hydrophobic protein (TIGR00271 family)
MKILTIISHTEEALRLSLWGLRFADAGHSELLFLCCPRSDQRNEIATVDIEAEQKDPLIQALQGTVTSYRAEHPSSEISIVIKKCEHQNRLKVVLSEISASSPDLLIVGQQRSNGDESDLARELFDRAICDTMLLRLGNSEAVLCDKILVPAAGGAHSIKALQLCSQFIETHGGDLTPLFIEPEIDSAAQEIGERFLERLLDKAKIGRDEHVNPRVIVADDPFDGIKELVMEERFDLILVGAPKVSSIRRVLFGTVPDRLLSGHDSMAVGIFRSAKPLMRQVSEKIESWLDFTIPKLTREERVTLFETLQANSRWSFDFMALIALSTAIAALGLILDSSAVVIGAMLVAPLMTPLIGSGMALAQGNIPMFKVSTKAIGLGFLTALIIGILTGWIFSAELTDELIARGRALRLEDMGVAFLSGIAAAYCVGRPNLSGALPGVAIAAALVPPIATTGICFAMQEPTYALGAAKLFAANVVAIVIGAAVSLYLGGARGSDRKHKGSLWAQRILLALVVAAIFIVVPLFGSFLHRNFGGGKYDDAQNAPYRERVATLLAQFPDHHLTSLKAWDRNDHLEVEIVVRSPANLAESVVEELGNTARAVYNRPVRLRVSTRLVQEIIITTPAEPAIQPSAESD